MALDQYSFDVGSFSPDAWEGFDDAPVVLGGVNPLALAVQGVGFGPSAMAAQGFVLDDVPIAPYSEAADTAVVPIGNYLAVVLADLISTAIQPEAVEAYVPAENSVRVLAESYLADVQVESYLTLVAADLPDIFVALPKFLGASVPTSLVANVPAIETSATYIPAVAIAYVEVGMYSAIVPAGNFLTLVPIDSTKVT